MCEQQDELDANEKLFKFRSIFDFGTSRCQQTQTLDRATPKQPTLSVSKRNLMKRIRSLKAAPLEAKVFAALKKETNKN